MTRAARARKQLGIPKPVCQFKIWPEGKRQYYYDVLIYQTRGQMSKAIKYFCSGARPSAGLWGFTESWRPSARNLHPKSIGWIFLCLWTCTDNTVSHEILHAIHWWSEAMHFSPHCVVGWNQKTHERVAEAHGHMVSQFWENFSKAGLNRSECWGFPAQGE